MQDVPPEKVSGDLTEPARIDPLIDPDAQLAELTDLVQRGLLSSEEFEHQRRKVLGEPAPLPAQGKEPGRG